MDGLDTPYNAFTTRAPDVRMIKIGKFSSQRSDTPKRVNVPEKSGKFLHIGEIATCGRSCVCLLSANANRA